MDAPAKPSLLRRLLGSIARARPGDLPRAAVRDARRTIWLCHALLSERGDVSGARLAREALAAYQELAGLKCFRPYIGNLASPNAVRN